jgi:hypothetical protein
MWLLYLLDNKKNMQWAKDRNMLEFSNQGWECAKYFSSTIKTLDFRIHDIQTKL